ncbi:FMN-binding negative transcriptional regulator [Leptobacterium sp. I13]|uniref:FMN-binding negative transcriptional regulator n=1 Tax=Leptobacterium meishanense TaxID=3128904 RepID=UPI0030EBBC9C
MINKYPPAHHQEGNFENIVEVIKSYPLATLISVHENELYTTHLPLIYEKDKTKFGKLVAHIDKYNPHVKALTDEKEVTAIFHGPETYISPAIYTTSQLPTWNYIKAHIKGTVTRYNNREKVKQTMIRMTTFLEHPKHLYTLEQDDPKMEAALDYVVGFEINITAWEGKFKWSQDKLPRDQKLAKETLIKNQQKGIASFIDRLFEKHQHK